MKCYELRQTSFTPLIIEVNTLTEAKVILASLKSGVITSAQFAHINDLIKALECFLAPYEKCPSSPTP